MNYYWAYLNDMKWHIIVVKTGYPKPGETSICNQQLSKRNLVVDAIGANDLKQGQWCQICLDNCE